MTKKLIIQIKTYLHDVILGLSFSTEDEETGQNPRNPQQNQIRHILRDPHSHFPYDSRCCFTKYRGYFEDQFILYKRQNLIYIWKINYSSILVLGVQEFLIVQFRMMSYMVFNFLIFKVYLKNISKYKIRYPSAFHGYFKQY